MSHPDDVVAVVVHGEAGQDGDGDTLTKIHVIVFKLIVSRSILFRRLPK